MTRALSVTGVVLTLASLAVLPACDGSEAPGDASSCEERDGRICGPDGFPFAVRAVALSDYCFESEGGCPAITIPPAEATTARLIQPLPGKLCLAGRLATTGGLAVLHVGFSELNADRTKVTKTFNADARGIAQMTFSIDSPPPGPGVLVAATITAGLDNTPGQRNVIDGFRLMTPPLFDEQLIFREPGPVVAPFASFRQTDPNMSPTFDTTLLDGIAVAVGGADLDYDFCIRDFKFRDAAGNEVAP
jgi:hypothetical protein